MRKVATINGVAIYSDKQMIGYQGTSINFADGSSCDVLTNTIVNNGPGDIQIGEIPRTASKAPKTSISGDPYRSPGKVGEASDLGNAIGPMRYLCQRLHIADLPANVLIEVWDQSDMEFYASGPSAELADIIVKADGSTLKLGSRGVKNPSGGVHVSGISIQSRSGGSRVTIHGSVCGSISLDGDCVVIGDSSVEVKVTVKVPRGTDINLAGTFGDVEIGDVNGALKLESFGNGNVRCGRLTRADIKVSGNGNVRISEVNGPIDALITGTGDVKVKTGKVTSLDVRSAGTGNFKFGGTADTAKLTSTGTGDIKVAKVNSQPIKRCTGTGDIRVG